MALGHNRTSATALLLATLLSAHCVPAAIPRAPGELAWSIRYDPKTLDPAKVDEQASEMVRFLTAGVLLRTNRQTQQPQPELASAYTLSRDGLLLTFRLRENLRFSDNTPLTSADVAWSLRRVLAPTTAAPVAQEFLAPERVKIETPDPFTVQLHLPKRIINVGRIFDEIAIEPVNRPSEARITSGPFTLADYKRGQYLRLSRNPNFWKHDAAGHPLPYSRGIRLDILNNREQDVSLFVRGEYDLIDNLSPNYFNALAGRKPNSVRDLGPSLNTEQLWFNQAPNAPIPDFEKAWYRNRSFRVAISQAIHRADLARIAYVGRATPAYTFISPANTVWRNPQLQVPREDPAAAAKLLTSAGFHKTDGTLFDSTGHPVRFSILTNAGNGARQKMATLIQQDLAALGIEVTVVTLDFPALIDRLMHTANYQSCLLGLSDVDPDPNTMMNVWLSSSPNHQWNPSEPTPATPWENEIDAEMRAQASALTPQARKRSIDRIGQIVADQQPFIYLVFPNTLYAISPDLLGVQPAVVQPGIVWNVADLHRKGQQP